MKSSQDAGAERALALARPCEGRAHRRPSGGVGRILRNEPGRSDGQAPPVERGRRFWLLAAAAGDPEGNEERCKPAPPT